MKRICAAVIMAGCIIAGAGRLGAVTVDELGTGAAQTVLIDINGTILPVDAGLLKLNVGGLQADAFCIDPFHFSDGSMSGYHLVGLTSAPKGNLMSASTALELERLWASFYSPSLTADEAAGLQIAIWEITGGSGFKLHSANDFGAAGLLAAVEAPNYNGPEADLLALTGPGQDYAVAAASVAGLTVPDTHSTLLLLVSTMLLLFVASWRVPQLAPVRR